MAGGLLRGWTFTESLAVAHLMMLYAVANRNGASHITYSRGDPDVAIEIRAQDLGIEGFWAWVCRKHYTISLEEICELLD